MTAMEMRIERTETKNAILRALDMADFARLPDLADRADRARMPALAARLRALVAAETAADRAHNAVTRMVDP